MSLLDILHDRHEEVLEGTFYADIPKLENGQWQTTSTIPIYFTYEIVNESDKAYANLINNLEDPATMQTIKTNDKIPAKIGSYIVTQDGKLWTITGFITKVYTDKTKQTMRYMRQAVDEEKIIRLTLQDNPWDVQ